jgi:hypothetical protein
MPSTSPEALARKRKRDNDRRKERRRTEPGYTKRETRTRSTRTRSPESADRREASRAKAREAMDARPFVGCDGEGIGRDPEHRYALFRMGERELYDGGRRLDTPELLRFIVDHPDPDDILVAFAFDYDVNMILRDMPADRWHQLLRLNISAINGAKNPYTRNGGWTWLRFGATTYGVQYIPRNYLRVCVGLAMVMPDETVRTVARPGSTRTIYDTFGNFQSSFLVALNRWSIGAEHWPAIKAGKDARSSFDKITPGIRNYCAIECRLLAEMMTAFRSACLGAGIRPRTWNGAGKLAAALMRDHGVMRKAEVETRCQAGLLKMAHEAYYGGRFEVTRCGLVDQRVTEFDINSAYPAAMPELPCLEHGTWRKMRGDQLTSLLRRDALFVCSTKFKHPRDAFLCGLPFRSAKDGKLSWPRMGRGVYWSPEIRSAMAIGARVELGDGWLYERRCQCRPFDWVVGLYEYRRRIGKAARGQPLKLGYNSIYGKWAQRVGHPPFANPIYAGLCTAMTRAKLNHAIAATPNPRNVIMLATDAIYTIGRPPRLDLGEGLGQWERKQHRSLFIVRPGLYWPPKPRNKAWQVKSRGLSPKFFEPMVPRFRRTWSDYIRRKRSGKGVDLQLALWMDGHLKPIVPPVVQVSVTTFVGHRLALHLNKLQLACQWITHPHRQSFECHNGGKRSAGKVHRKAIVMPPLTGDEFKRSATYEPGKVLSTADPLPSENMMWFEAMPDPIELSAPHVD